MPRIKIPAAPKKVIFGAIDQFRIIDYKTVEKINTYTYRIPLVIDAQVTLSAGSQIKISVTKSRKKQTPIAITDIDLRTGRVFQKVRNNKKIQQLESLNSIKLGTTYFMSPIDIANLVSYVDVEIKDSDIGQFLNLSIDCIDAKNYVTNFDTCSINHKDLLALYEVPKDDFVVRVGFYDKNTASLCATTRDPKIGSFNFFARNASPMSLRGTTFLFLGNVAVDQYGNSQLDYDVSQYGKHLIAATPVAKTSGVEFSNTKYNEFGTDSQDLMLGFFINSISDDVMEFSITNLTPRIKKLLLYRQIFGQNERKLIDSAHISSESLSARLTDNDRLVYCNSIYTLAYIDDQSTIHFSPTYVYSPELKLNTLASIVSSVVTGSQIDSKIGFDVGVNYNSSTAYDLVVEDLKTLGLNDLLDTDLKKMTNNLKPLTRVLASRINKTTGIEENMGIHQPGIINLPYADDSVYRFEVAIRSTPEVLENLAASQNILFNQARDSKDPINAAAKALGTNAKFNQTSFTAKYFSNSSLRSSLLKYGKASDGIDLSYYAGRTGIFSDVNIKRVTALVTVTDIVKRVLNSNGDMLITWSWSQSLESANIAFKIGTDTNENFALVTPNSTTASYFLKGKTTKKFTIVPIVDGLDEAENSRIVETV